MLRLSSLVPVLFGLVACSGAAPPRTADAPASPTVKALSPQAAWLVRRIGGSRVAVEDLVPAGEDPATWSPSGEVVASLGEATLIVANGAGYEAWTKTATLPTAKLVDTARGLDLVEVEGPTHSHGKQGDHSHAEVDPHTWTDPAVYARQGAAVHAALVRVDPAGKSVYDGNLANVERELATLGGELDHALASPAAAAVVAADPGFRYLARRAGITPTEGTATRALDRLDAPAAGASYDYLGQARANVALLRALPATADTDTP